MNKIYMILECNNLRNDIMGFYDTLDEAVEWLIELKQFNEIVNHPYPKEMFCELKLFEVRSIFDKKEIPLDFLDSLENISDNKWLEKKREIEAELNTVTLFDIERVKEAKESLYKRMEELWNRK